MVEEMIRRFNKNEECRCLCLDKILDYYGMCLAPKNSIKKIDNFIKTYRFLKQKGFFVEGYIDKRLLINPKFFLYLQKKDINFNKNIFTIQPNQNCIYLYYTSAKELYGIDEAWTHCICEIYQNGKRIIYDSYWSQIKKQYKSIKFPVHADLCNKIILALKIRRK